MKRSSFVFASILLAGLGFALGWHLVLSQQNEALRDEIARRRALLLAPNGNDETAAAAAGSVADEQARLQAEIESLEDEVLTLAAEVGERPSKPVGEKDAVLPAVVIDRGTPELAWRSFLGALEAVDPSALEKIITMDEAAQAEAKRFYRDLPEDARSAYASSDSLVAAVMAARSPTGLAAVGDPELVSRSTEEAQLRVTVKKGKKQPGDVTLSFRLEPDGWRLVVPAAVITGYRYSILEMPASTASR